MNAETTQCTIRPLARVRPGAEVRIHFSRDGRTVCASTYRLQSADAQGATVCVSEGTDWFLTGGSFAVELAIGDQPLKFTNAEAQKLSGEGNAQLIRISWEAAPAGGRTMEDRPPRWMCDEHLAPACVIENPYELYGRKCFKVENFSRTGMRLISSQPMGLLVPGMKLKGGLQFPGMEPETVTLELRWIRPVNRSVSQVGVRLVEAAPSYYASAGQYLFQYVRGTNVAEIRRAGLLVPSVSSGLSYEFAHSAADYFEVLQLRKENYRWAQASLPTLRLEELGDEYDARANILIARHWGKCVGSLRIIFPGPNDPLEQSEHVTLPGSFPPKEEIAEVTRICIDPEYRKGDLMLGMLKHALLTVLQNRRSWIAGCAEDNLLPYYQAIGATGTDLKYQRQLGDVTHNLTVILFNIVDYLNQAGVSQAAWNLIAPDILTFADRNGIPVSTTHFHSPCKTNPAQ
ncbi:MAG: GNAT family N-acyltransferase [Acidobacteriota bacterium]